MRPYKLPTDEWIDLDHVLAIGPLNEDNHECVAELTISFQNETKKQRFGKYLFFHQFREDNEKRRAKYNKENREAYNLFVKFWGTGLSETIE